MGLRRNASGGSSPLAFLLAKPARLSCGSGRGQRKTLCFCSPRAAKPHRDKGCGVEPYSSCIDSPNGKNLRPVACDDPIQVKRTFAIPAYQSDLLGFYAFRSHPPSSPQSSIASSFFAKEVDSETVGFCPFAPTLEWLPCHDAPDWYQSKQHSTIRKALAFRRASPARGLALHA